MIDNHSIIVVSPSVASMIMAVVYYLLLEPVLVTVLHHQAHPLYPGHHLVLSIHHMY